MKLANRLLLLFTFLFFVVHMLFFWTNAIVDSYFYWAIGDYFRTGVYKFAEPFIYIRPPTISPPLYGVLLMVMELFERPDIILHFLQLCMLALSGWFVYKTVRLSASAGIAIVAGCVFVLIPANSVYATHMMTETPSQLFLSVFTYLISSYVVKREKRYLFFAVFVGFVMGLMKYSLVIYGLVALGILLVRRPKLSFGYVFPALGMGVIGVWVMVNNAITGAWGLSDANGVNLYNQVVWNGGMVPSEQSGPMLELRTYVPVGTDMRRAYWEMQHYILPVVGNDWLVVDRVLGAVARQAIREDPVGYLKHSANLFVQMHQGGMPYWENMDDFGETTAYPSLPSCGFLGKFHLCEPIIRLENSHALWNAYIRFSTWFHMYVTPAIHFLVLLPGAIYLLIWGARHEKFLIFLYLAGTLPVVMLVHMNHRYHVPFNQFVVLICVLFISSVWNIVLRRRKGSSQLPAALLPIDQSEDR